VQALFEQLEVIHPILPPIVRAIVVVAVALLLWVIASVPAYWMSQAVSPALFRLAAILFDARTKALALSGSLFGARQFPVDQFVGNHAQVFALGDENDRLVRALGAVRQTISVWPATEISLERSLLDGERSVKESRLALQRIEWPRSVDAPTPQQYSLIRVEQNDAWLRTVIFAIFSAFLIAINTLMLREFFASIMPPVRFLGIPVAIIFSFLFSVLELIFGFCLAFVERPSLSISGLLRAVLLIALTLLALIELGFYAQFGVALDFNPFATLWAPNKPPMWTNLWLGLFGPLVVMGLGFSGHGLAVALRELSRDNVVRQYRRFLNLITRKADELETRVESTRKVSDGLINTLKDLEPRYKTLASDTPGAAKQLDQIRTEVQAITIQAQSIRQNPFQQIGPSEMLRSFLSYIFVAPTAVIAFMLIALAFGALGFSEPFTIGRAALPGFGVAAAETALMIGIGYATGRVATRTSGHDAAISLGFVVASA
jgi:hypothetical protein